MLYFPNIITLLTNSTITAIGIVMYIIFMIAAWNIFEKAGEAGWKAIIPIWNVYILYKITWGIGLIFLLMLIPVVGGCAGWFWDLAPVNIRGFKPRVEYFLYRMHIYKFMYQDWKI